MKILYFSPHPNINLSAPSGPGTHIREIIAGFEEARHEVIRFIEGGEQIQNEASRIAFKRRRLKKLIPPILWQTLRDLQMLRLDKQIEARLLAVVEREKPDLIYERSCYGMGSGMRVAKQLGIRYIVEMNAPYPEEKVAMQGRSLLGFVGVRRERAQVHAAYKTVVVSSAMKHYLVTKTGIAPNRVHIEANAVDPTKIHTREENLDTIRRRFQIDSSHMVFGFVGSIFPYHGVDLMITAFAALEKEFPSARMLIVGDGEVLPLLQQRAKNLSLESKVHFTGNIRHQEVFDYLAVMNITVMARSNWYGSPVKIFEYGAMRKAIIAPNVVPVQDVMEHQVHGLLIEDNVQALQEAMRFMIEQDATRAQMAERFHHKVMTEHTWKIVAQHILAAVQ